MGRSVQFIAGLAVFVAGMACGGHDEPIGPPTLCNRALVVTATGGSQPYFTWQPDCIASERIVLGPSTGQSSPVLWWIRSTPGFTSGITYGTIPVGGTEFLQPAPPPFAAGSTVNVYGNDGNILGSGLIPTQ